MEFEEKLIALVRENDFLYNTKSRKYKNILQRDATWATISTELGRSVAECKQGWKSLRDRYVRERRRMEQPSGSGSDLRPEWELLSSLQFLDRSLQTRQQTSNSDEAVETDWIGDEVPLMSPQTDASSLRGTPDSSIPTMKRRRRANNDGVEEFLGSLSQTLEKRFCEVQDDNDFYLKMLGIKMKELPEHIKIKLQEKFLREVNDEILKHRNFTQN